jgi:hypothetical protein
MQRLCPDFLCCDGAHLGAIKFFSARIGRMRSTILTPTGLMQWIAEQQQQQLAGSGDEFRPSCRVPAGTEDDRLSSQTGSLMPGDERTALLAGWPCPAAICHAKRESDLSCVLQQFCPLSVTCGGCVARTVGAVQLCVQLYTLLS